jgi:hypothetical protein
MEADGWVGLGQGVLRYSESLQFIFWLVKTV